MQWLALLVAQQTSIAPLHCLFITFHFCGKNYANFLKVEAGLLNLFG